MWTREAFGDRTAFVTAWTYWMSNLPYFPGILYFGASRRWSPLGRAAMRSPAARPGTWVSLSSGWS